MKKLLSLTIVFAMVLGLSSFTTEKVNVKVKSSIMQAHKWERLGMRKVNMGGDHDEILVTAHEGAFTKLKFRVLKAPIHVHSVKIVFGNGEAKKVKIDRKFAAGTESRVIDLPGNKRIIKKIVMNYKTVPTKKGKATVVVWGKH